MTNSKMTTNKKIHDYYYDAMEYLNIGDTSNARKLLKKSIELDPDYVEAYVGMTATYREMGDFKKEKEFADLGFEKTREKFPQWPEEMSWGEIENRQYLRAICYKADTCQISGDLKQAEELYRLILKMNPRDNQGVRYLIAGMFAGLGPQDIDDMFDEGNKKQDWSKLEILMWEQNKQHHFWEAPEEY